MKKIQQWIVSGIVAASLAATMMVAGTQEFYSRASQSGRNDYFSFCPPATCTISATAGLNNPTQPMGGGGAGITVKQGGSIVLSVSYSGYMSGSSSNSVNNQAGGVSYDILHYVTAGNQFGNAYGHATTTFSW